MLRVPYNIKIESAALARRYVAKSFSSAKQEYTMQREQALQIGEVKDAKRFARTWAERIGVPFSVWQGEKRVFTAHVV